MEEKNEFQQQSATEDLLERQTKDQWSNVKNKITVHTLKFNMFLIPDNQTATAEGKDQLQLGLQLEVD